MYIYYYYHFQDTRISGIMYFIIGILEVLCVISSFMLPETKNADLDDKIITSGKKKNTGHEL